MAHPTNGYSAIELVYNISASGATISPSFQLSLNLTDYTVQEAEDFITEFEPVVQTLADNLDGMTGITGVNIYKFWKGQIVSDIRS